MGTNERFVWATEVLDLHPADRVLEIGCGAGILVEQIAERLDSGTVMGIDKSESMIRMASKRNRRFVLNGKVNLINTELAQTVFKRSTFDKVLAFNVNLFFKKPARELEIIRQCLKPHGRLYVFYQAPYEITKSAAKPVVEELQMQSFEVTDVMLKKMIPTPAFCILAKRS